MNSKKVITAGFSIAAILFLSGCTAKGPQFSTFEKPKPGEANLYIYRKAILFGDGLRPDIHKTDMSTKEEDILAPLQPNGYIVEMLKPGEYEIWGKTEAKNEVIFKVEADQIYCIQHYVTPGFFIGHPQFELQDLSICEPEIRKTKLSL